MDDHTTTPNIDLTEGVFRRAWVDYRTKWGATSGRGLWLSLGLSLAAVALSGLAGLDSWSEALTTAAVWLGAFVAIQLLVYTWYWTCSTYHQRNEARREIDRLRLYETEAMSLRQLAHNTEAILHECQVERDRLRPFEALAIEREQELRTVKAQLSTESRKRHQSERENKELRNTIDRLETLNAHLEEATPKPGVASLAKVHRGADAYFKKGALERYHMDAKEAVLEAATVLASPAGGLSKRGAHVVALGPMSGQPLESLFTLNIEPRGRATERKRIKVDAVLSTGLDVPAVISRVVSSLTSRDVQGYLVLVDELHEYTSRQVRSAFEGISGVEVVALRRNAAPYRRRLHAALERLVSAPSRSEEDRQAAARWLEEHEAQATRSATRRPRNTG
jgi:hypothetical protein